MNSHVGLLQRIVTASVGLDSAVLERLANQLENLPIEAKPIYGQVAAPERHPESEYTPDCIAHPTNPYEDPSGSGGQPHLLESLLRPPR
jgi:hypothetical protein